MNTLFDKYEATKICPPFTDEVPFDAPPSAERTSFLNVAGKEVIAEFCVVIGVWWTIEPTGSAAGLGLTPVIVFVDSPPV